MFLAFSAIPINEIKVLQNSQFDTDFASPPICSYRPASLGGVKNRRKTAHYPFNRCSSIG